MKTSLSIILLSATMALFPVNAEQFIPPTRPMNEAEAYQNAHAMLSPYGFRTIHSVSAHYYPDRKISYVYENWVDVPTRQLRQVSRQIHWGKAEANPLQNLGGALAAKPDRGFWKSPHGDLSYNASEDAWKPTVITASPPITGILRTIDKGWFLWSSFERSSGTGQLCCGQSAPSGANDHDVRVKRHADLLKQVSVGASAHHFKETDGLVDDYQLVDKDGVIVWRIKNEYLKEWPFAMDEQTKQAAQKVARVAIHKWVDSYPMPTTGRGFGFVIAYGPGGAVVHLIQENSPAAVSGIAVGDQLVSVNGVAPVGNGANAMETINKSDAAAFVLKRPNGTTYSVNLGKADWSVMNSKK